MAEPNKRRVSSPRHLSSPRHWVGLLLLLGIASHANASMGDFTLHGTVVDGATGLPIAGADVRHLSIGARYSSTVEEDPPPGWSATPDDEGQFTLAGLPCRDVYLQVRAEGHALSRGIRVPPDTTGSTSAWAGARPSKERSRWCTATRPLARSDFQ